MMEVQLVQVSGLTEQYQVQCDGDSETSESFMF